MNEDKSHWDPVHIGEWLGFVINTIAMTFQIPEAKVRKLKSLLSSATRDKSSSYRELARIAGSILFVAPAVGPTSIYPANVPGNRIPFGVGPHPSFFLGSFGGVKILVQ